MLYVRAKREHAVNGVTIQNGALYLYLGSDDQNYSIKANGNLLIVNKIDFSDEPFEIEPGTHRIIDLAPFQKDFIFENLHRLMEGNTLLFAGFNYKIITFNNVTFYIMVTLPEE